MTTSAGFGRSTRSLSALAAGSQSLPMVWLVAAVAPNLVGDGRQAGLGGRVDVCAKAGDLVPGPPPDDAAPPLGTPFGALGTKPQITIDPDHPLASNHTRLEIAADG